MRYGRVVAAVAFVLLAVALSLSTVKAEAAPPTTPNDVASVIQAPVMHAAPASPQTAAATVGWSQQFGSGYGNHPLVSSNRNPSWSVSAGNPVLTFQVDCNLVDRSTSGGGAIWASNSVAGLRPCLLDFQLNGDVQIRNAASQLGWHTGVIHTGTVYATLALYDSGCLVEYYYNVPTQKWLNQWRTDLTNSFGIDCASYTG